MKPIVCNPTGFCFLLLLLTSVNSLAEETGCSAPTVTERETARLEFHLPEDVVTPSIPFYAHLVRNKDQKSDILRCYRQESSADVQCTAKLEGYTNVKVDGRILKVSVPNVTLDYADTYLLRVYVNDEPQTPISCSLTVKARASERQGSNDILLIVVPAVAGGLLLAIGLAVVIACLCHKRNRRSTRENDVARKREKQKPISTNSTGCGTTVETPLVDIAPSLPKPGNIYKAPAEISLLHRPSHTVSPETEGQTQETALAHSPKDTVKKYEHTKSGRLGYPVTLHSSVSVDETRPPQIPDDLKCYPWYFGGIRNQKAQEILSSAENGPGCFLVIDSSIPDNYVLKAKFSSGMQTYYIQPGGLGYLIKGISFPSVPALIDYYTTHQGPLLGLLSTPCTR